MRMTQCEQVVSAGYVEFKDEESVPKALKLTDTEPQRRPIMYPLHLRSASSWMTFLLMSLISLTASASVVSRPLVVAF